MKYIATGHNSGEPKNDQKKTEGHRGYKRRVEKQSKSGDGQNGIKDEFVSRFIGICRQGPLP